MRGVGLFDLWPGLTTAMSGLSGLSGITSSKATSATDTFTGTDGTNLNNRLLTTGGGKWTAQLGAWQITSNQAVETTNSNAAYLLTTDTGWTSFTVQADVGVPATTNLDCGIVFRYVDTNNYYMFIAENAVVKLYEISAGVVTQRGSAAVNLEGTAATLKVNVSGNNFTCYTNGTSQITFTGALFTTSTLVGLRNFRGAGYNQATFDNFQWTSP